MIIDVRCSKCGAAVCAYYSNYSRTSVVIKVDPCEICAAKALESANSGEAPTTNSVSPKLLCELKRVLPLVRNGMPSNDVIEIRGVIADCIAQLRA